MMKPELLSQKENIHQREDTIAQLEGWIFKELSHTHTHKNRYWIHSRTAQEGWWTMNRNLKEANLGSGFKKLYLGLVTMISKSERSSSSLEMIWWVVITGYTTTKSKVLFAHMHPSERPQINA